jgi:hypothetical protein
MFTWLCDLATLKILNRNFVECKTNFFEARDMKEPARVMMVLKEDFDMAGDTYFGGVRGLAYKYHVNEIDLAWQLCFQVEHKELVTA